MTAARDWTDMELSIITSWYNYIVKDEYKVDNVGIIKILDGLRTCFHDNTQQILKISGDITRLSDDVHIFIPLSDKKTKVPITRDLLQFVVD